MPSAKDPAPQSILRLDIYIYIYKKTMAQFTRGAEQLTGHL